jgi:hypothetical protein
MLATHTRNAFVTHQGHTACVLTRTGFVSHASNENRQESAMKYAQLLTAMLMLVVVSAGAETVIAQVGLDARLELRAAKIEREIEKILAEKVDTAIDAAKFTVFGAVRPMPVEQISAKLPKQIASAVAQ